MVLHRRIRSASIALVMMAELGTPATAAQDPALTDLDRRVLVDLTGTRETKSALFHFVPGAIDDKTLDADVAANVAAFARLEKSLQMKYSGRAHVFLYVDGEDMKRRTGTTGGVVAFSTGTVSVHQPHDFRGVHEFVHLWALQFPRPADASGPDLFTTEGLATILAESDEGVPIQAWAAAYSRANVLPASLVDLRRTFTEGCPPGVHPYHVAGSFVGFLLDRFGIEKVKRWYVDSTEAHEYFGVGFARLEREWREWVAKAPLDPAHEKHVRRKLGLELEPMPAAWATAPGSALFDGKSLAGLAPEEAAKWSVKEGVLVGTNDDPWTHLATAKSFGTRSGVRARLRLVRGNAIKLRLCGSKEAIFATWSSYATAGAGFVGNDRVKIPTGKWVDLVVVNDGGRARVSLDGTGVFDSAGIWSDATEGSLAIGVERGQVEIKEWVAFEAK